MGATPKGFYFPDGDDPPLAPLQISILAGQIDAYLSSLSYAEINALTGPEVWEGRQAWQGDTGTDRPMQGLYVHDGVEWRAPWNLPWGAVAPVAENIAGQGPIVGLTDLTGLAVTWDRIANRRYEVLGKCQFTNDLALNVNLYVRDGSNVVLQTATLTAAVDGFVPFTIGVEIPDGSGPYTVKLSALRTGSSTLNLIASATQRAQLSVTDIGPSGDPT